MDKQKRHIGNLSYVELMSCYFNLSLYTYTQSTRINLYNYRENREGKRKKKGGKRRLARDVHFLVFVALLV
jgi:hypothetical protein